MKVFCAWCRKLICEKDGCGIDMDSHGICDKCRKKFFPKEDGDGVDGVLSPDATVSKAEDEDGSVSDKR